MNKYFYIYNPHQADFFVKEGALVVGVGKGTKGDVFIKFLKDKKCLEIFDKWVVRGKQNKLI
jgi:hypothetical protein